ncbi:LysR family transcriptional regulator [Rhizobium sp. NRK18]|uniref:LysR family transcriptional regulator n=1 Tax=Rhizobium sp. NRK18 TaxID=2964667 RepID=UPI0021C35E79|nr:LysR family transcriptional regulator [Rhizobium sp. NRK18]MCQ2004529.1 LysR family transcriptional regulator [Rhizobium sp. NRK18]
MISDWSDLQTILAIATEGTLSGAARRLGLNQSTVSRRLQAVEQSLNRQLFLRANDGRLVANQTGEALAQAAGKMQACVEEANAVVAGSSMPLRIATCEILASRFAAPMLAAWSEKSGQAGDIAVHDNLFVVPDSEFEVMVTPLDSAPADMVGRRVGTLDWNLYATSAYLAEKPIDQPLQNLDGHRVIRASGSLEEIGAFRWLSGFGGSVAFTSSSVFSQRDFALTGKAVAMLPETVAELTPALKQLPTAVDGPVSEVWMVARKSVAGQPRVRAFLDWANKLYGSRGGASAVSKIPA